MKCDSCTHNKVCGHKQEYAELEEKLPKTEGMFSTELKCSHYGNCQNPPYPYGGQYIPRDNQRQQQTSDSGTPLPQPPFTTC